MMLEDKQAPQLYRTAALHELWARTNLVVRNLEQRLVDALKQQAARHGRSAEAEHRAILEAALLLTPKKSFAEVLSSMPDVGQDEDFKRREDKHQADHVFD